MGINIFIITEEQKNILIDSINDYIVFRPIKDANNNYLISQNEYDIVKNLYDLNKCPKELIFIKDLIASEYLPKPIENPFI